MPKIARKVKACERVVNSSKSVILLCTLECGHKRKIPAKSSQVSISVGKRLTCGACKREGRGGSKFNGPTYIGHAPKRVKFTRMEAPSILISRQVVSGK